MNRAGPEAPRSLGIGWNFVLLSQLTFLSIYNVLAWRGFCDFYFILEFQLVRTNISLLPSRPLKEASDFLVTRPCLRPGNTYIDAPCPGIRTPREWCCITLRVMSHTFPPPDYKSRCWPSGYRHGNIRPERCYGRSKRKNQKEKRKKSYWGGVRIDACLQNRPRGGCRRCDGQHRI